MSDDSDNVSPHGSSGAQFSPCRTYRYWLWRAWVVPTATRCTWIMLNPSTASYTSDDPTIRRCVGFARSWGYGAIDVVNLFGLVSADPRIVAAHADPVGPSNDSTIRDTVARSTCRLVVVAWGAFSVAQMRSRAVLDIVRASTKAPIMCLGTTSSGAPRHPLYLAKSTTLVPYGNTP